MHLDEVVGGFSNIQPMTLSAGAASYVLMTALNGQPRVFVVEFVQGGDGVWRIASL